jgi:multicomponent Na+:H+ antiporter subunit D
VSPTYALLPPLLVVPFIVFFGDRYKNLREASILFAGISLFFINVGLYQAFLNQELLLSDQLVLFPRLSLYLYAEPLGIMFGLLASFLWVVTTIYSIGYMRAHGEKNQTRFYVFFALAISAVMAAAYAGNLLTLFIAYELITIVTLPLVTHAGTPQARRAGRIYLGVLMGSSILLLLPAIIIIWWMTGATDSGTTDFVAGGILGSVGITPFWTTILLTLIVLGTAKAALMPFHSWLPNAMVAPTPVSALLHAVAVVKTGVFLIVKVVVYIFGFELIEQTNAADFLLVLSVITIVVASLIALRKDNLKARLAYSTISQLAYMVMAALLANAVAVKGAALHMVTHAFGKITLFFCAGAIMVASHKKLISELDGIGKFMPITMSAFFIAALSIIGLPPLAGVWSKLLIIEGSIQAEQLWLVATLILGSLLSAAYLLPICFRAFFAGGASSSGPNQKITPVKEAPLPCLIAILITTTACLVVFFQPNMIIDLVNKIDW